MGKMIGKKLYTYQSDDDDPITNKKSMKRREEAEWRKEFIEAWEKSSSGGILIGDQYEGEEVIVDTGSLNHRLNRMLEDLPQRTEAIGKSITITVRNPYTVEDADPDDLVNHWRGDPDDTTGEADCE